MRSGRRVDRRSCCGGARHEGGVADRDRADGRGHVMQFGREHRMVPQVAGRQILTVLISKYSADIDTVNIRGATTKSRAGMATNKLRRYRGYHHGDLPSALILGARRMLEKAGPESISFRAIAREAGVSQTAPYNHFTSKEHLLATLATIGFRELEASQAAATKDASTINEQIDRLGRAYVRFACRHPQLYRLMFGAGLSDWRAPPRRSKGKETSLMALRG